MSAEHWSVAADRAAKSWTIEDAIEFAQGGGSPTISERRAQELLQELSSLRADRLYLDEIRKVLGCDT